MNMSKMGSKNVQNAVKKTYEDALREFEDGIIGQDVWSFLFTAAGLPIPPGLVKKTLPHSQDLKGIKRENGEMIITTIGNIKNGISINGLFWGRLGVSFKNNFSIDGPSWRRYLQTGFAHEVGIFVGNPAGVGKGLDLTIHRGTLLGDDHFVPFSGLQVIPESVHYLLKGEFLNKNHVVLCNDVFRKNVMIGGGDSHLKMYDKGVCPHVVSLGKMRKVFID